MFNNSGLFIFLFFQLCIFIFLTAVILEIINLSTIKKKTNHFQVLFISTTSYSPFALAIAITYFILQFNALISIILIGISYALSINILITNLIQIKFLKGI